ncbi:MAG: putative lipid II flippase FtsW [Clostridiales bacterium]|jgi:cell division protein FtsW|nr:putative lipid II flippase FtsW [Clostridiales bacterium]
MENTRRASARRGPAAKSRVVVTELDGVIAAVVFVLLLVGIVMVFSSSYYTAMRDENVDNNMFHYVFNQLRAVGLGIVAMIIMAYTHYRVWEKLSGLMYIAGNILLILTRFIGIEANNARRWLRIPVFGQVQTSEIVKVTVILFLAFFIAKEKDRLRSWKGFILASIIVIIPAGLAYVCTSSLSSAITIGALGFGMIFIASPFFWRFIVMLGAVFAGGLGWLLTTDSYQGDRLQAFFDPFADPLLYGYQTIQSLYAVASGGLFGLGLGNSRQKLIFMPEPHNDFIFAIICEELGFFGAAIIILLFSILIYRGVRVALNAPDLQGTLIATGIIVMLAVQVIINVGVVTSTIPNTGIPLPFISYGGSSVLFLMALMGILLNISRYSRTA